MQSNPKFLSNIIVAAGYAVANHDENIINYYKLQADLIGPCIEYSDGKEDVAF